jgi:hypothetical protein
MKDSTVLHFTPLSYAALYGARMHPTDLRCTLAPCWTTLHLLSYAAPLLSYLPSQKFLECQNVGLSDIWSVRYRNEKKWRCRNHSGTRIRRPNPVPECSGTRPRWWMPDCRYRRHQPWCQCPAMHSCYPSMSGPLACTAFHRLCSRTGFFYTVLRATVSWPCPAARPAFPWAPRPVSVPSSRLPSRRSCLRWLELCALL